MTVQYIAMLPSLSNLWCLLRSTDPVSLVEASHTCSVHMYLDGWPLHFAWQDRGAWQNHILPAGVPCRITGTTLAVMELCKRRTLSLTVPCHSYAPERSMTACCFFTPS